MWGLQRPRSDSPSQPLLSAMIMTYAYFCHGRHLHAASRIRGRGQDVPQLATLAVGVRRSYRERAALKLGLGPHGQHLQPTHHAMPRGGGGDWVCRGGPPSRHRRGSSWQEVRDERGQAAAERGRDERGRASSMSAFQWAHIQSDRRERGGGFHPASRVHIGSRADTTATAAAAHDDGRIEIPSKIINGQPRPATRRHRRAGELGGNGHRLRRRPSSASSRCRAPAAAGASARVGRLAQSTR